MNCQQLTELLHGYLDRELDPVRSLEAERHLKECPACSHRLQEQQALRKAIASQSLYFEAPGGLERRMRNALREVGYSEAQPQPRSWRQGWSWLGWLAPAAAVALALLLALPGLVGPSAEDRMAREILSAHLSSLMANHLTDVASTDQHTVKPWFNGKLTFSPPVVDLADQGFPLIGGRVDVLDERPVAAVVYQRRKHFINLCICPSSQATSTTERIISRRGYNLVHWTKGGMDYWAVSDVNANDLRELAHLVQSRTPQQSGE
jgi:anti-sigma factor RsiW